MRPKLASHARMSQTIPQAGPAHAYTSNMSAGPQPSCWMGHSLPGQILPAGTDQLKE